MDFGQALLNPLTIAGLRGFGGFSKDLGDQLHQGALLQTQQQHAQAEQAQIEMQKQKALREQKLAEALPQVLQGANLNDPHDLLNRLAAAGAGPQEIAAILGLSSDQARLGLEQQGLDIKREGLGIERGNLGLRQQELARRLQGAEESAKIEKELRSEVAKESGEYKVIKSAYKNIQTLSKDPSPTKDLGMVYSLMKLYDPGARVTEGDYANVKNAGGVPERVIAQYNELVGGGSLSPDKRKDIVDSARQIYKTQVKSYKDTTQQFKDLSERYKVNPKNVVLFEPEEVVEEELVIPQADISGARAEAIRRGLIKE